MKLSYPLRGNQNVTAGFGWRGSFQLPDGRWTDPMHWGVDWAAPEGTPIYAAHDGVITVNGWDTSGYGGGNQVQITNGKWSTWYLHLRHTSPLRVGQRVRKGQLIGYVGSTGASTGPHLHMELHLNGEPVNPAHHLEDEMTPEQARMLKSIYDAIFNGGNSMKDGKKSISQSLAEINAPVRRHTAVKPTSITGKEQLIPVRQDNADTNTMVRQLLEEMKRVNERLDRLEGK